MLPVISTHDERVEQVSDRKMKIIKAGATIHIEADTPFSLAPTANGRVFNHVPGLEAVPVIFASNKVTINIHIS
jgi:hypothetical protein